MADAAWPGRARLVFDHAPALHLSWSEETPNELANEVVDMLDAAEVEIVLVSAYLIPTPELERAIERAEQRGVDVRILTNSLRSNNHLAAHSAYRTHIRSLLDAGAELYEVREGDTLWSIAEEVLGDPSLWPALYRANRDRIKDPRQVYPGQRLSVPSIEPGSVRAIRQEAVTLLAR